MPRRMEASCFHGLFGKASGAAFHAEKKGKNMSRRWRKEPVRGVCVCVFVFLSAKILLASDRKKGSIASIQTIRTGFVRNRDRVVPVTGGLERRIMVFFLVRDRIPFFQSAEPSLPPQSVWSDGRGAGPMVRSPGPQRPIRCHVV
jgi:hypothetical protein